MSEVPPGVIVLGKVGAVSPTLPKAGESNVAFPENEDDVSLMVTTVGLLKPF